MAGVLDLASRHLLGWSMSERHDAGLVTDALHAAVATRGGGTMPATIFHTDRGAEGEYISAACRTTWQRLRQPLRLRQLMGPHRVVSG